MLSLVAIPVSLALSAALQVLAVRRPAVRNAVFIAGVGAALLMVVIGIPGAVAGNATLLTFPDPLAGISIGLITTASGYTILGLSLGAALILAVGRSTQDDHLPLLLGLLGVAISCLASSVFTLACGAQIVVFAVMVGIGRDDTAVPHRQWLELGVLQAASAFLIGTACWYQLEASTTSFNVLPASAGNVASLTWAVGIVLLLASCVVSARARGLVFPVVAVGALLILNAVRMDQITPALTQASAFTLVTGGCIAGVLSLLQIWRASNLTACLHWLWVGTLLPLLFVTAVQDPTGVAVGAIAVSILVAGTLLALAATSQPLGLSRALAIAAVAGLPFGPVLTGWISAVAVMAGNQPARPLAWILVAYGVLWAPAGWRIALRVVEPGPARNARSRVMIAVVMIGAAGSLLPGWLAGSIFTWVVDGAAASGPSFSLPLATGGTWPGGLIAAISLAGAVLFFSSATILGISVGRRHQAAGEAGFAPPGLSGRASRLMGSLARAVKNVDDWLVLEPRLATVVLAGAVALAVFR